MSTPRSAAVDGNPHDAVLQELGITPLRGYLSPLKTKGEIRASNELIDVYVVELPARSANAVLNILRSALPPADPNTDIQHLRRVIKPSFLPAPALALLAPTRVTAPPSHGETRLLLICPTTQIPQSDLAALLSAHPPFKAPSPAPSTEPNAEDAPTKPRSAAEAEPFPLTIHALPVPALAPTSAEQADAWTRTRWPVAYKHTNPFGPHPALVARAAAEVAAGAGAWLALAERAAREAVQQQQQGMGAAVGAVVVERRLDANGRAVMAGRCVSVAGDGRACGVVGGAGGNVMAHAAMRAIGMVGLKRVRLEEAAGRAALAAKGADDGRPSRACCDPVTSVFAVEPRTPLEEEFFERDDNLAPNGYLCVDLEIYLTHEPCVMCAMAILHSRFNRVVFTKRMPRSGGLTADEQGLGHGLFWRPAELNWKFLCWEFVREEDEGDRERALVVGEEVNA